MEIIFGIIGWFFILMILFTVCLLITTLFEKSEPPEPPMNYQEFSALCRKMDNSTSFERSKIKFAGRRVSLEGRVVDIAMHDPNNYFGKPRDEGITHFVTVTLIPDKPDISVTWGVTRSDFFSSFYKYESYTKGCRMEFTGTLISRSNNKIELRSVSLPYK